MIKDNSCNALVLRLLQEYRTIQQHDTKNLRSSLKSVILPIWTSTDRKEYPGQFRLLSLKLTVSCAIAKVRPVSMFWRT
ncbi:MAG: hypothetical protein KAU38_17665, partial [Desulfobacterales bacterium]|nr:hypothetical protein [Desulfobacterales bacterium]